MDNFSFLYELEKQLHSPEIRQSAEKISALLSNDFFEFGSSGNIWTRNDILARLPAENSRASIQSSDYKATPLADDVVLITYQSSGSLRSSIWRKNKQGWQMEFHQGTPKA